MPTRPMPMGLLFTALLAAASCRDDTATPTTETPATTVATADTVPDSLLQRLAARYRVLREEPAPPPAPSPAADPTSVPERVRNTLPGRVLEQVTGEATFYANLFEGRRTASGIPFRQNQMVAAHRAYPFGTILRVTNLRNDRSVNVRVVDRGPFGARAEARRTILDLSQRAARELDYIGAGRAPIRVEVLEWGTGLPRG